MNTFLELTCNPYPDGSAQCGQIGAAHRVEVVAVGQIAAHQLGSQVFADFVAQVGDRLPTHGICIRLKIIVIDTV